MKKIIASLLLIFSVTPAFCTSVFAKASDFAKATPDKPRNLQQPPFSPQKKNEAITGYVIKMLDELIAKNIITATHLQRLQESPELINPMTATDRAASLVYLDYAKGLDSFIAQGKSSIDVARVKDWAIAKIAELQHDEDTRKRVHEDTREIHRSMKFVELPAGKYVDSITHEEFEMSEGIEIQDTPVTQWQWFTAMGANPSHFIDGPDAEEVVLNGKKIKIRADASVENISWNDVQAFIEKLNEKKDGYVYALPSVQEYQAMMQTFQQKGAFVEYHGKRVWDIAGKVWQWTRDTVEMKDKQAHLVFGGVREIKNAKDTVRPVVYEANKNQAVGLRLIRYKKSLRCERTLNKYSTQQLSWNQKDINFAPEWEWDEQTQQLLMRGYDGLCWMFQHKEEYAIEIQHMFNILPNAVKVWSRTKDYVDDLIDLDFLKLDGYNIPNISPLKQLINLQTLNLNTNRIQDISPLKGLINLNYLYLENNEIQDINLLHPLINLKFLRLEHNKIKDITPLQQMNALVELVLNNNEIRDISPLKQLANLRDLYLDHNKIQDINSLQKLSKLYLLCLQHNQIQDINSLKQMINLKILRLGNNQIKDISPLTNLINLEELQLSQNPISSLLPLKKLKNLKELYLDKNQIEQLHATEKRHSIYYESALLPGIEIHKVY